MRLRLDKSRCADCAEQKCVKACPLPLNVNSLECRHCPPEEAACALSCPRNAIIETAEGILSIDLEKCNGCGECAKACEFNAITLKSGKAFKCDLCSETSFKMACVEACEKRAIGIERHGKEIELVEKALGWRVFGPPKKKRALLERESHSVIEARDGKKWYLVKEFPDVSAKEAVLLREMLECFQAREKAGIAETMEEVLEKGKKRLDEEQKQYFLGILYSLVHGFGPLSLLLSDESLEEIALVGTGKSNPVKAFHRLFGWCECNFYYYSKKSVADTVNRMLLKTERRLSMANPRVNGVLPDGSRLNATIPPVSFQQPSFTIRKFDSKKFTPTELVKNNTISAEAMAFLWLALETDCSMLVAGNTGSGKTTTLNALFSLVPRSERIVSVEETPELGIPHRHRVKLNTCKEKGIGMAELIVDSLRMRPDRVVVGEVRNGEEARAFVDTLLAGQGKGSYATFHSVSAKDAVKRLELLGIRPLDICSLDLLIVQKRLGRIEQGKRFEERKVIEVAEVIEKSGKPLLNPVYGYSHGKKGLVRAKKSKKVLKKAGEAFSAGKKGLEREMRKKKKAIEKGCFEA